MNIRLFAKRDNESSYNFRSGEIMHGFEFKLDMFCDTSRALSELIGSLVKDKSSFRNVSVLKSLKKLGFSIEVRVEDNDIYNFIRYMSLENIENKSFSRIHYSTVEI